MWCFARPIAESFQTRCWQSSHVSTCPWGLLVPVRSAYKRIAPVNPMKSCCSGLSSLFFLFKEVVMFFSQSTGDTICCENVRSSLPSGSFRQPFFVESTIHQHLESCLNILPRDLLQIVPTPQSNSCTTSIEFKKLVTGRWQFGAIVFISRSSTDLYPGSDVI